jgi:hypothetical protein
VVLEVEFRAWCLLGRCSVTWASTPGLFCYSYFGERVLCFWPGPWSSSYASLVAGMTSALPHPAIGLDGVLELLCPLSLADLKLPSSLCLHPSPGSEPTGQHNYYLLLYLPPSLPLIVYGLRSHNVCFLLSNGLIKWLGFIENYVIISVVGNNIY